ncbi:MAG TPA: hypothetical protein VFO60_06405 [Candidatus Dormibacteraeota bacterium]|nr:hypothetical protein [Candidatus Dormibacteraeota bacterium]
MTATDQAPSRPARPSPPSPDECAHPQPVRGVMAHEFSPYSGAMGPEGLRRTTMYYGPVVGGLPIAAWHCEVCGLLKLDYPDSRKEERRLFPGPQPGLIAGALVEVEAPEAVLGMQARVSGLSVSAAVAAAFGPPAAAAEPFALDISIPSTSQTVDGLVVLGLVGTMTGLLALAVGAVYDWTTASWEGPIAVTTGVVFGSTVLLKILSASFQHFFPFPRLAPSPGDALGGRPQLDAVAWTLVAILVTLLLGLLLAGTLAVYDWKPPDAERPIVFALVGLFVALIAVAVGGGAARAVRGSAHAGTDTE